MGLASAFLTAVLVFHGSENAATFALSRTALTYVANIAGNIVGGTMADRWGRLSTILTWSCVSLALSFSIGWLIAAPIVLVVALACLYNFAGIADSSTHSTVLASVPAHYLGVAYAVRSAIGFGAGVVVQAVFGWALDASDQAWGLAWTARPRRAARPGLHLETAQAVGLSPKPPSATARRSFPFFNACSRSASTY